MIFVSQICRWSSSATNEMHRLLINDTSSWFERQLEYPIGKDPVKVVTILVNTEFSHSMILSCVFMPFEIIYLKKKELNKMD